MRAAARLIPAALLACSPARPRHPINIAGPPGDPDRCPAEMVEVQGGARDLGEWSDEQLETWGDYVIPTDGYAIETFCMSTYPFPGDEGDDWPLDGLSYDGLGALAELVEGYDRRICTVTELMYAAAGKDNWRFPYDLESAQEGICEPDDSTPGPLGSYPDCVSPFGLHDFQVRSAWGYLDPDMLDLVEDNLSTALPEDHEWAVWGGTSRSDTYYAPDNFGIHFHAGGEDAYLDDSVRLCADRSSEGLARDEDLDAEWAERVDDFREQGSFEAWLAR